MGNFNFIGTIGLGFWFLFSLFDVGGAVLTRHRLESGGSVAMVIAPILIWGICKMIDRRTARKEHEVYVAHEASLKETAANRIRIDKLEEDRREAAAAAWHAKFGAYSWREGLPESMFIWHAGDGSRIDRI